MQFPGLPAMLANLSHTSSCRKRSGMMPPFIELTNKFKGEADNDNAELRNRPHFLVKGILI